MSLEKLTNFVNQGDLEITQILSPPRTLSTVLSIALTEIADGQVHEPLNDRRRNSFNEGCQLIIDRVEELRGENRTEGALHLIVKDLAKHVTPEEWQELKRLAHQLVFVVREPSLQIFSLIRRRVTGAILGYNSSNVSDDKVFDNLGVVSQEAWIDNSWSNLELFLNDVEVTEGLPEKTVIVSELSLRLDPIGTMRRMSEKFGWLPFNEKLAGGWTKAVGSKFYHPPFKGQDPELDSEGIILSGWINQAVRNTSFLPLNKSRDQPIPINRYPQRTKEYILDQIFPVYVRMLLHPLNISYPSWEVLVHPVTSEGDTLGDINPIETYVLLHGYEKLTETERQVQTETNQRLESRLQQAHPEILDRLNILIERSSLHTSGVC